MDPTANVDNEILPFEKSQIAWLRNEYGGSIEPPKPLESGGPVTSTSDSSDPSNVASFFANDNVALPPRPVPGRIAPSGKQDDNLFHIERLLLNNTKTFEELTNEDWEKSLAEVKLMAFQNQGGFSSRGAAVNAMNQEAGGLGVSRAMFKKAMEVFMDRITRPINEASDRKYADVWKAASDKALEVVYTGTTVAEVAAEIRDQFKKLLGEYRSGAVLLFQGSSWTSKMIRALTPDFNGRFSHVAFYMSSIGDHKDFLLWQSGEEGKSKAPYHPEGKEVSNQARNGPDLHCFAEALALYLEHFPGSKFILRNIPEEHVPNEDLLKAHVDKLLLQDLIYPSPLHLAFGYQLGRQPALADFVRAYYGDVDEKAKEYFCSQLVASTFLNTDTLDPAKKPSAGYSPSDFGCLLNESPDRLAHKKTNKPLLLEERELKFIKK